MFGSFTYTTLQNDVRRNNNKFLIIKSHISFYLKIDDLDLDKQIWRRYYTQSQPRLINVRLILLPMYVPLIYHE